MGVRALTLFHVLCKGVPYSVTSHGLRCGTKIDSHFASAADLPNILTPVDGARSIETWSEERNWRSSCRKITIHRIVDENGLIILLPLNASTFKLLYGRRVRRRLYLPNAYAIQRALICKLHIACYRYGDDSCEHCILPSCATVFHRILFRSEYSGGIFGKYSAEHFRPRILSFGN